MLFFPSSKICNNGNFTESSRLLVFIDPRYGSLNGKDPRQLLRNYSQRECEKGSEAMLNFIQTIRAVT